MNIHGETGQANGTPLRILLLVLSLVMVACGGGDGDDSSDAADPTEAGAEDDAAAAADLQEGEDTDFRVALLLPGKVNDQGWNAIGLAGLEAIQDELGAEIAYTEDVVPADQEEAYRDYASQGFDLVMAMGGQFTDGALAVAEEFPDTRFGVVGSNATNGSNMASFNARQEQVFFLAGVVAGLATETDRVAYISGVEVDNVLRGAVGFEQGVEAVNPDAEIQQVWTGDFEDVATAKEAAVALIEGGYDVVQANSNAATFGALEAAEEGGVYGIGAYGDYTFVAPNAVLTNSLPAMDKVILEAGRLAHSGEWESEFYLFGYQDFDIGGIGEINADVLGEEMAASIQAEVDSYLEQIQTETIEIEGPE